MKRMDLNSDVGEGFGVYKLTSDEKIISHITSANIACGFHAGDGNVMNETVVLAKKHGVGIGAHPSFPDLTGFGRRMMRIEPEEVYRLVVYQIGALQSFCTIHHVEMQHVKPHGALYNLAATDKAVAYAIARAVYDVDKNLILFGLAGSELIQMGEERGLQTASEVFADRTYQSDGTLTPRTEEGAVIKDVSVAKRQVLQMIREGKVTTKDRSTIPVKADTICVHGDGENAIEFVRLLRQALKEAGVQIKRVGEAT